MKKFYSHATLKSDQPTLESAYQNILPNEVNRQCKCHYPLIAQVHVLVATRRSTEVSGVKLTG